MATKQIKKSVGDQATNNADDVKVVRELLNEVSFIYGGPIIKFRVDATVVQHDQNLIQAIRDFQRFHFGDSNGRIEPDKSTMKTLNAMAEGAASIGAANVIGLQRKEIIRYAGNEADRPDKVAGCVKKAGKQSTPASAKRLKEYFTVFPEAALWKDEEYENGYPGGSHWCGIFATWVLSQVGMPVRFFGGNKDPGIFWVKEGNTRLSKFSTRTDKNYTLGDICLTKEDPSEKWPTHHFIVASVPGRSGMMDTIEGNYGANGLFHAVTRNKRAIEKYSYYSVFQPKVL